MEINENNTHELKILPQYFDDVASGKKSFEIRKADRDFKVGDFLILKEWEGGMYTGRAIIVKVDYIYQGDGSYGLSEEYCILGLYKSKPEMPLAELSLLQQEIINLDLKYSETKQALELLGRIEDWIREAAK